MKRQFQSNPPRLLFTEQPTLSTFEIFEAKHAALLQAQQEYAGAAENLRRELTEREDVLADQEREHMVDLFLSVPLVSEVTAAH